MNVQLSTLVIILCCAVVTAIPRIIPFMVIRNVKLPRVVGKWLSFIPVCIFTALIADSFMVQNQSVLSFDWKALVAIIPTLIVALWTKNLAVTVIVGIVGMATVRLLF
ncbi:AzlD domain-containing protein [Cohnella boryungensis]|uniref:AzlD domain-containing protein n=1 Tax=Cohnella boryungensis TaxID=768479 RepID=A0ABV8SGU2_9BACL